MMPGRMDKELDIRLNELIEHIHELVFGSEELVPKVTTKCLMQSGIREFVRFLMEKAASYQPPREQAFISDMLRYADMSQKEWELLKELKHGS